MTNRIKADLKLQGRSGGQGRSPSSSISDAEVGGIHAAIEAANIEIKVEAGVLP